MGVYEIWVEPIVKSLTSGESAKRRHMVRTWPKSGQSRHLGFQ